MSETKPTGKLNPLGPHLSPEEARKLVAWAIEAGLMRKPRPPLVVEAPDLSPDVRKALAEREAKMRGLLDAEKQPESQA